MVKGKTQPTNQQLVKQPEQVATIPFGRFFKKSDPIPFGSKMGKVIKSKQIEEGGYKLRTVVIDPGHGGFDSGCLGGDSQEKNIALAVSKKLANEIQYAFPDVQVIMTRSRDVFIPLHKRADIANKNKADLFISIHCNAMRNASYIKGSETYVLGLHRTQENFEVAKRENAVVLLEEDYEQNYDFDPNSDEGHIMLSMVQNAFLEQSILFASKVENQMATAAERHSRGVKQAGFQVLRQTAMPAVLVETGFLTNSSEERFLSTAMGQQKVAVAIFEAFKDYKAEVETGIAVSTSNTLADNPPRAEIETIKKAPSKASKPKAQPRETFTKKSVSLGEPFPLTAEQKKKKPVLSPIHFRVQLAASPKPIDIKHGKWRKLNQTVEVIREEKMYKYQIPRFQSFEEADRIKINVRARGFKDAFIVAYQNGKKVNIHQAKKQAARK